MRIKKTDSRLAEINQMKDLISIEFRDLMVTTLKGRNHIIPGFIVLYGSSKFLFLTTQDPYFEVFVEKLRKTYLEEKDRIVSVGITGEQKIKIDDFTKQVLLGKTLEEPSSYYSFYQDKTGYEDSLFFEEDKVANLEAVLEFLVEEVLKYFQCTLQSFQLSSGMNGVYHAKATVDKINHILPMEIIQEDFQTIRIQIGNILTNAIPVNVRMRHEKNGFSYLTSIPEFNLYITHKERVEDSVGTDECIVMQNNQRIVYYKKELPVLSKEQVPFSNLMDQNESKWFQLPWGDFLGTEKKEYSILPNGVLVEEDGPEKLVKTRCTYISNQKDHFFLKDMYSKEYKKRPTSTFVGESITYDRMDKKIYGRRIGNGVLMETTFGPMPSTGFYKEHLSGKYFYHVAFPQEKELTKEDFISLNKKMGLFDEADLIDIKQYQKKENQ